MIPDSDKIRLFNIQRYSVHDGDGIRTNIFLKGCPLKCKWCSNPESQRFFLENTYTPSSCMECQRCVDACPTGALSSVGEYDRDKCKFCFRCAKLCPTASRAFIGEDWDIDSIVDEVLKDRVFYTRSGGGVTITGGEPLAQSDKVAKLARALKKVGLHLAIETCGFVKWSKLEPVLSCCDQVLYDIKEMDDEKHLEFTGVSNTIILENARKAAKLDNELIIRVPVIGGYNDTPENIHAIAKFAADIGVNEINLLAFHRFGENKYEKSGMKYECKDHTPDDKEMQNFKEIIEKYGIETKIGG